MSVIHDILGESVTLRHSIGTYRRLANRAYLETTMLRQVLVTLGNNTKGSVLAQHEGEGEMIHTIPKLLHSLVR